MPYLKSALLVVAASLLGGAIQHSIAQANLVMFYIMAVVIAAIRYGRGPSITAAVLSVLIFDLFFVPPRFSLKVDDYEYVITFIALLVVALTISTLMMTTRAQTAVARGRELQARTLYEFNRDLAVAAGERLIVRTAVAHTKRALPADAAVFIRGDGALRAEIVDGEFRLDDAMRDAVNRVFATGDPVPGAGAWFLPVKTAHALFGVLGVAVGEQDPGSLPENRRLLETIASQTAIAIERARYADQAKQAVLLGEAEKLHAALLNSVTHDLRTPLASITGSLSSILEDPSMDRSSQRELTENALEQAERLNQLVGDLLDMARVEAGALHVVKKPCDLRDVIGTSLKRLEHGLEGRKILVAIAPDFLHIPMDFNLMMKVFINVLDNACKYSPPATPVEIRAELAGAGAEISIGDHGMGVPPPDLENIFNKFFRAKRPHGREGTGLGLSICRGIVEAHGGRIVAENRAGGSGLIVTVALPLRA
jgi:two-component system sensor histidine kinase KdpD